MKRLDRSALLLQLERLKFEKVAERLDDQFEHVGLGAAIPPLAQLNHETVYRLAQSVALHLLGHVPEPTATDE